MVSGPSSRRALRLDPATGTRTEFEPRWQTLPAWLAAAAPSDMELDSWVSDTQTLRSADGALRQELRAWRLSPATFLKVVASRPLRRLDGRRLRPDGPWAAVATLAQLAAEARARVEAETASAIAGGRAGPPGPAEQADLAAVVAAAPDECRRLVPASPQWAEAWGLVAADGSFSWGQVAFDATRLGWVRGDGGGWTAGAWAIVGRQDVSVTSESAVAATSPSRLHAPASSPGRRRLLGR